MSNVQKRTDRIVGLSHVSLGFGSKGHSQCGVMITVSIVEIHGSRAAELQDLLGCSLFSSLHVSAPFREILHKKSFESSKNIRFQKKV